MKTSRDLMLICAFAALFAGCGQNLQIPPTTAATGTNAHSIDEVAEWVKGDYHIRSPETPPYITNQPIVVAAAQLFPLFSSQGAPIDVRRTDYRYCNLPNAHWLLLRRQSPSKFPILWAPAPDASGQRLVVTVDFKSDMFWPATMPEQVFTSELARMEAIIRSGPGQSDFSLKP